VKSTNSPKKKAKSTKPVKASEKPVKAQEWVMPVEVKEWIDQASSRLQRLASEVARLKEENHTLKVGLKFAEKRILQQEEN